MKNSKRKGFGFMLFGVLLLAGAGSVTVYNTVEDRQAGETAEEVVSVLKEEIVEIKEENWEEIVDPRRMMPTIEIDGYRYIGVLSIDVLEMELPIMEEWDYNRLKIAPCRYSGSVYEDNMVIAGHNYRSHFTPVKTLPPGTVIRFSDVEGTEFIYEIDYMDVLNPDQVEEMTMGDWDLTLFTCTYGGSQRNAIRCNRIE